MTGKHATGKHAALTRRTLVAAGTTGALAGLCAPFIRRCARGADGDPLRHRRRHRPQRDGDGDLSRLDAEERAQGLRQGLHRRHDLHPRHAGSRHAARSRPSRHGDAVVCGLCHLRDQEHRARRHDHRVRQLPGRAGRFCAEHVLRAQGFAHQLDAGSQGQEGRRQRLRLRRRSRVAGQAQEGRHRSAQGSRPSSRWPFPTRPPPCAKSASTPAS